tara:strand:- start:336 stop:752 length:417 start_codon:yes stop_codon:yes gene_type:complete
MKIIYENPEGGVAVVTPAPGASLERVAVKVVPSGASWWYSNGDNLPVDNLFRSAWVRSGEGVIEDLEKSKEIAHEVRREKRRLEFRPHDEIIAARIPGTSYEEEEEARSSIRVKYESIQADIDSAETIDELRTRTLSI